MTGLVENRRMIDDMSLRQFTARGHLLRDSDGQDREVLVDMDRIRLVSAVMVTDPEQASV
jgi:hypothetical protein